VEQLLLFESSSRGGSQYPEGEINLPNQGTHTIAHKTKHLEQSRLNLPSQDLTKPPTI
jgi:hypothetical protein